MIYFGGKKSQFVINYVNKLINDEYINMTKAGIARKLDIKPQYLNSIMSGARNVSDKFFIKFIAAFNIKQNDLDINPDVLEDVSEPEEEYQSKDTIVKGLFDLIREKDDLIIKLSNEIGKLKEKLSNH